jgi:RNA polymerase sigma factor (sigma-70 family)
MLAEYGTVKGRLRDSGPPEADGEAHLIAGIRARDLQAFETLYHRLHPRLARFLTNLVHRPQLVEEVLNDTMLVVWERLDTYRGDSKLSTWIFAIAYRKAMKAVRRQDEPAEDSQAETRTSADAGPEERAGLQRLQSILAAALEGLSADHRTVVDLTYFHELDYREIAQIMDCPIDTVKTRMFHARRRLRTMLPGDFADWL